jgi:hypothetical protein
MQHSSSASPHDHNNIDPAIAGSNLMSTSAESGGDDNGVDGRKGGKRELSTSKRAAQNRAAQVRGRSVSLKWSCCYKVLSRFENCGGG